MKTNMAGSDRVRHVQAQTSPVLPPSPCRPPSTPYKHPVQSQVVPLRILLVSSPKLLLVRGHLHSYHLSCESRAGFGRPSDKALSHPPIFSRNIGFPDNVACFLSWLHVIMVRACSPPPPPPTHNQLIQTKPATSTTVFYFGISTIREH